MGCGSSCWVFLPGAVGTLTLTGGDEGSTWIPVYLPSAGQGQPWGRHWSGAWALCWGNLAWKMRDFGIIQKWGGRGRQWGEAAAGGAEGSRVSPGEVTEGGRMYFGVSPQQPWWEPCLLPAPLFFLPVCPEATLDPGAAGSRGAAAS